MGPPLTRTLLLTPPAHVPRGPSTGRGAGRGSASGDPGTCNRKTTEHGAVRTEGAQSAVGTDGGGRAGAGRGAATACRCLPPEGWIKWGAQREESSEQRAQPHQRGRGEGTSGLGLELRGEKAEAERARLEGP